MTDRVREVYGLNAIRLDAIPAGCHIVRAKLPGGLQMNPYVRVAGILAMTSAGCASVAPLDNPIVVRTVPANVENPLLVSPGEPDANGYAEVYERVIDVLDDYFDIKPTSRYAGHIETFPHIAPGFEQPWKAGNPDHRERLIATFQTMRKYAIVDIWAGERGGYKISLEVRRELLDIERPSRATAGGAVFREAPTVDRRNEVIQTEVASNLGWIPVGRDCALEQQLLARIRDCAIFKQ